MTRALAPFAALLVACGLSASALAQTAPNPVLEHFRAYRAAIAAGDMSAAETAAAAALAASEARDGDGGRTAVLALNLASLRLELDKRQEAIAPAQRAVSANSADVSPALARLVLGRAQLSSEEGTKIALNAAIAEAAANPELSGDIYLASLDLGRQEMNDERYREAAAAWAITQTHVEAAPGDPVVARAQLLTLEAIALIYTAAQRTTMALQDEETIADRNLHQAMSLMAPFVLQDLQTGSGLSEAVRVTATARAWHSALDSRLGAPRWPEDELRDAADAAVPDAGGEFCSGRIDATRMPSYPSSLRDRLNVGAVVLVFHVDANGEVTEREVIAAAPSNSDFVRLVERVYNRWRIEWRDEPGCVRPRFLMQSVVFRLSDGF